VTGKVERVHLRRAAYVYVRQSTMAQVERNKESLERQYELVDRAVSLGWAAGDVVVVDRDLGVSAKSAVGREGFERLVTDVGLGKVGIVLGIEVSRLARRNADWYQLLDLCALTNTLIADADGIYHPGLHNDRLLLGLKGTMSEAELHVLRTRMREGALHKVAKGALRISLPTGYDYDELGQVRITPDEAVADAIATVFAYFDQLASARQVMVRLVAEGRRLPRRHQPTAKYAGRRHRIGRYTTSSPIPATPACTRTGESASGAPFRTACCANAWSWPRVRSGTRSWQTITPDTSPSSAGRPTRPGCAPTCCRGAGMAVQARHEKAERCCRGSCVAGAAVESCKSATAATR